MAPFCGEGDIMYLGIPIIDVDGSSIVHAKAEGLGVENCLITVKERTMCHMFGIRRITI